jgi:phage gpG-like protein
MDFCRNPIPSMRPNFHDILNSLLEDEQKTLEIPREDASVHKQATMLGGPLTASENMYKSLRKSYTNNRFSVVNGEILYDSIDQYQPVTSSSSSDIKATSASSYNHYAQYSPAQNEPLNATDGDDIYDDITNCATNFSQAATYEVPEYVQGSRKPPVPSGPPPFDDTNDMDYEEI